MVPREEQSAAEEQTARIPTVIQLLREGLNDFCLDLLSNPKWNTSTIVPEFKSMLGFLETLNVIWHSMPEESVRDTLRNTLKTILKHSRNLATRDIETFTYTPFDKGIHVPEFCKQAISLTGPSIRLSQNYMKAWVNVDHDFKDILTPNTVVDNLNSFGINKGLIVKNVKEIFDGEHFDQEMLVAEGIDPICGHNGTILFCIHLNDLGHVPKLLENGNVSFKDIQLFDYMSQGDKLARIVPPQMGTLGYTVLGQAINPPAVYEAEIPKLDHTSISEDGEFLLVNEDCCISKKHGQIHIEPTVRIIGDVSYESGNIDSNISVVIGKDVHTGFSVQSKKDVEVVGVIEGADMKVGGVLFAKGGIQAKDKGSIEVQGDLHTKLIKNASVICTSNVLVSKEIIHSNIHAEGRIIVSESPAHIIGGIIHSELDIVAHEIGSDMGMPTKLVLGGKVEEYQKLIQENETEIEQQEVMLENCRQIIQNLTVQLSISSSNEEEIVKAKQKAQEMQANIQKHVQTLYQQQEIFQIEYEECLSHPRTIRAKRNIWPGTTIQITGKEMVIKDPTGPATVLLKGEEITVLPYSDLPESTMEEYYGEV